MDPKEKSIQNYERLTRIGDELNALAREILAISGESFPEQKPAAAYCSARLGCAISEFHEYLEDVFEGLAGGPVSHRSLCKTGGAA